MSSDYYLKIDGIKGEAKDTDHKDEIEVYAWNWSVSQGSSSGSGQGLGSGKGTPGPFEFTHNFDKASTALQRKCADGTHIKDVTLSARKAGGGPKTYLVYTFKQVLITSVSPGGSQGGDVVERVTLSYKEMEAKYKPQKDDGELDAEVKFGWIPAENKFS
ncbi:Hcp family type VI secretion system effector [Variovorax guangxiensis]|uniref:Type VI secretion system tube protein Hcp n=1 Tax=Variovorax guangxiensis TaxID=1775474 RepID=A0A502DGI8_9BURK|nr:type VI secretion system tube protein Hcp [Variovorax guangxiensis]TPG20163.1 type VI secretion system tube protein Hcp [Variovorax ginsengisoli]TPG23822.1 type VI secretion system tube protein Hcp [Variovorax guangxiensis]